MLRRLSSDDTPAVVDVPPATARLSSDFARAMPCTIAPTAIPIDKQATGLAYYVPWLWDNQINFTSKNVNGVKNEFNSAWDLTASSLK